MPPLRGIMSNLRDWSDNIKSERFCVLRFWLLGGRDIFVYLSPLPAALVSSTSRRPGRDRRVLCPGDSMELGIGLARGSRGSIKQAPWPTTVYDRPRLVTVAWSKSSRFYFSLLRYFLHGSFVSKRGLRRTTHLQSRIIGPATFTHAPSKVDANKFIRRTDQGGGKRAQVNKNIATTKKPKT